MKPLLLTTLLACASLPTMAFELSSPQLRDGQAMSKAQEFNGFGCDGGNVSPALAWKNAPAGTQSYAVTVYDPDAPTGSGWWHWLVFNLPATTQGLPASAGNDATLLPAGAMQSRTDFGQPGFGGACPPPGHGKHRYIFTVHALKVPHLDLPADASPALVGYMLWANGLGKASFTATYQR